MREEDLGRFMEFKLRFILILLGRLELGILYLG